MRENIAVVAHSGKSMGGGLVELRDTLRAAGVPDPMWMEIAKGGQAKECAKRAVAEKADVMFVWGGDGTVQRCIDVAAGTDTAVAILPAGTANLLARNLDIPQDIPAAVQVGLAGSTVELDTGTMNGEHFAVMAGAGLDALLLDDADAGLKDRFGRIAYLWTGARNLSASPVKATVSVEGRPFFKGTMTCVLFGNLSDIGGGLEVFEGARADDGLLDFGVVSAQSRIDWMRTLARTALGRAEKSPFVTTGRGTSFRIDFSHPTPYELDGGARKPTRRLTVEVKPRSVTVCVPRTSGDER